MTVAGREYKAVTNVGVRPTVDENGGVTVESHLLDVNEQLYGKNYRVKFLSLIRKGMKFPDLEALQTQIAEDIAIFQRLTGSAAALPVSLFKYRILRQVLPGEGAATAKRE